jgi:hypothetical protein
MYLRSKSADVDGITVELLQLAADEWAELLTLSFNAAFEVGQLSSKQRYGITSFLYKKKDPRDLRNWRPLTITSLMYKCATRVLQQRWLLIAPALTLECQHGFV